ENFGATGSQTLPGPSPSLPRGHGEGRIAQRSGGGRHRLLDLGDSVAESTPGQARCEAGFTLLELIVVLTIIGIALAIALPYLGRGTPGTTLAVAASEVRIALREARDTAIAEGHPVAFRGDPAGGYWLDRSYRALGAAGAAGANLRIATLGT